MICRDVDLPPFGRCWLLISQVEHARLSGELASHCDFGLPHGAVAKDVRSEMVTAIGRHDDGWAQWERAPLTDDSSGRPLSFQELPIAEAIGVWSDSIESAAAVGPLAAWMTAGHFDRLAEHSDAATDSPEVGNWRGRLQERRDNWMRTWKESNRSISSDDVLASAVDWLQLFDILSLWLCYAHPINGSASTADADAWAEVGRLLPLQTECQVLFSVGGTRSMEVSFDDPTVHPSATIQPWRFDVDALDIWIDASWVPEKRYASSRELMASGTSRRLHWRLRQT